MTIKTIEISLSLEEFIALIKLNDVKYIFGLNPDIYQIKDEQIYSDLTNEGYICLERNGWIFEEDGNFMLNGDLALMIETIINPYLVTLATKFNGQDQEKILVHYSKEQVNVELGVCEAGKFILVGMENFGTSIQRICQFIKPTPKKNDRSSILKVKGDELMNLKEEKLAKNRSQNLFLDGDDMDKEKMQNFLSAYLNPDQSGQITFLRFEDQEILDGVNFKLIERSCTSWLLCPGLKTPEIWNVEQADQEMYADYVIDKLRSLLEASPV